MGMASPPTPQMSDLVKAPLITTLTQGGRRVVIGGSTNARERSPSDPLERLLDTRTTKISLAEVHITVSGMGGLAVSVGAPTTSFPFTFISSRRGLGGHGT